jgi:predicted Zn-dependent protease
MRTLLLVALIAALVLPAAAQFGTVMDNVNRAKKVSDATTPWTPEQENEIGQAAAAKIIHIFPLYDNPAETKYVNLVAATVAQFGTRNLQYHVGILNTPIAWACAMPGGYVFVTRGALDKMKDESELAGTLAHEVAHVDARHLETIIRNKKLTGLAVDEGMSHVPYNVLSGLANEAVTQALTQNYGPDKENDADKKGTDFAAHAGYVPAGLKDFLETLAAFANDPANVQKTGMWNGKTHPPFNVRVANLNKLLTKYPATGETLAERFQQNTAAPAAVTETAARSSEPAKESAKPAAAPAKMAVVTLSGANLRLEVSGGALVLYNEYAKAMVGYELGCISDENKVTYRFGWKATTIAPKQSLKNPAGLSPDMGDVCAGDEDAKLTVVSAKFADGKTWSSGD